MLLVAFCSKPHWLFVCKPELNGFCFKLGWLLQCKPAWLLPCKLHWLLILALASLAFCSIGSPACMALNLQALEGVCFIYANHICINSLGLQSICFSRAFCGNICFEPCCFVLHYQLLKRRAGKVKSKTMKNNRSIRVLSKKNGSSFAKKHHGLPCFFEKTLPFFEVIST